MKNYFFAWSKLGALGVFLTMQLEPPKPYPELFSLMVAVCWLFKQRAYENMRISWIRKPDGQLHIFDWEAILMVPSATGLLKFPLALFNSKQCSEFQE